ncbi:MAG: ribonuclease E/G [Alphaproteobacteria bacterium HGW-Alphaproteobacteria-2]|nr:MAG: ribonuclease E/G [Alphaproteobacteria bacterium HGW-Alphaproteobacteria-2]
MAKKMLIDATHAEETRVVVVDGNKVEEFDFESVSKRQLAGNIYLAKVTRVEPSLQAAFVDYGGNRHGFLAFSEIHPDYYQIPVADRQALLAEEQELARRDSEEESGGERTGRSSGSRGRSRKPRPAAVAEDTGLAEAAEIAVGAPGADIPGMAVIDLDAPEPEAFDTDAADAPEPEAEPSAEAASETTAPEDRIESVGSEDVEEEIRQPRKSRVRRYKIQEVVKVRQIMLVQVVKEERGNKGAALTTYLSLAGRYCVLMPNTARGGGISRKITNLADRKKLKEIAGELEVPQGAGLIIRTAGSQRTKAEIKRDYEYLLRLWEQVRDLTLKSIAPAPIYEEGNLIKRSIRDLYNRDIDEVLVEGEEGYRLAKDFMKMLMPSHAKNVKNYSEGLPLFARFQVESYLAAMFNPTVQLKSGGYIVIGVTEALVAIDVNSGRATKEGSIEETALKTNLEAAEEIARQLRLRDLAGLIVIDFIDMDERRNNAAVEKRLKEKLKSDRARIQIGRISGFGLLEMSRQRLRPGMLEATTQPCPHCHGTGLIRNDESLALSILRQLEEEGVRQRSREVLVRMPVGIVNFLINAKREHLAGIEARYGLSVRIEADPSLVSPDFAIERFKTASRPVPVARPVVSVDMTLPEVEADEAEADEDEDEEETGTERGADTGGEGGSKKKRRRRKRGGRGSGSGQRQSGAGTLTADSEDSAADGETGPDGAEDDAADAGLATAEAEAEDVVPSDVPAAAEAAESAPPEMAAEAKAPKTAKKAPAKRSPASSKTGAASKSASGTAKPRTKSTAGAAKDAAAVPAPEPAPEPAFVAPAPEPEPQDEPVATDAAAAPEPGKPAAARRRGWWSNSG